MGATRCNYCKRGGRWVHHVTGGRLCSRCKALIAAGDWDELARLQLRRYPEQWVEDVAAFIQMTFEGASLPEAVSPLVACDGCDGSICGRAHTNRRVLAAATVLPRRRKQATG
jgi:hypothetical protein